MICCESCVRASAVATRGHVFFDFDGTLANTVDAIRATAYTTLEEWGLTPEEIGDTTRLIGPPFPGAFCSVYGLSQADAEEVTRRYRERYLSLGPESYAPYAGVPEMLAELRAQGRHVSLVTSKREGMARDMAGAHGLLDVIDHVVGQLDPSHASKQELVTRALTELGVDASDAVMVGDRFYDIEGARACGVPGVGVSWGAGTVDELLEAGAVAVATGPASLTGLLLGR